MTVSGLPPGGAGRVTDVLEALRQGRFGSDQERLEAASKLLEGSFYEELFKAMRDTVPEGGALPAGNGQDMFESMLDQRVAEAAAMKSSGGLGSALYRHFVGALSDGDLP